MAAIISIMIAALFTNNIVLNQTIGICPFLGVSKKLNSAVGMGVVVTFVIILSAMISYVLYTQILAPLQIQYLSLIVFILVIASLVQLLEIIIKRFTPTLYNSMGIYLPLITTNCAVLHTANFVVGMENANLLSVFVYALFIGIGFLLALVLMAGVREKLEMNTKIPKSFRGFPIALLAAAIISLAFYGLGTLNLEPLLG